MFFLVSQDESGDRACELAAREDGRDHRAAVLVVRQVRPDRLLVVDAHRQLHAQGHMEKQVRTHGGRSKSASQEPGVGDYACLADAAPANHRLQPRRGLSFGQLALALAVHDVFVGKHAVRVRVPVALNAVVRVADACNPK